MWKWRRRPDKDFAEEIQDHISQETKRLVEDEGLSVADARARAIRSFGNVTRARERFFERGRISWLEDLRRDATYAVRNLRRNPGFAAVAILTLAVGIGATTAIYSIVDTILLQPLPFPESDRLVRIVENASGRIASGFSGRVFQRGVSYQNFLEWRKRTTTLSDVVAFSDAQTVAQTAEGTKRLYGGMVSVNTFALLGTKAMLGRTLDPGDERNTDVVVLGHQTWQRFFQADSGVVGKKFELRGGNQARVLTIVGVLPAGFEFPVGPLEFYRPIDPARPPSNVTLIGRLRDGVSQAAAMEEANVIGTAIRPPPPADAPPLTIPRFEVQGLKDQIVKELQPALRVLLAAVAVVLMIVCANVANLLLARGTVRQREMAVRTAIGAGRGRLIRQMLTECLVLAMAGGAIGVLLGAAGISLVKQLATVDVPGIFRLAFGSTILPRGNEVGVNFSVFGIAFGIAAIACVVFGLLPALQVSRTNHVEAIGARNGGARRGETGMRSTLVVGQLVLATTLLVSAGLLIKSFVRLTTVEKGYDPSNVLAVQLLLPGDYPIARKADTIDAVLARLRSHPHVQFAGFSRAGVLIGEEITMGTFVPRGRTLREMEADTTEPRLRSVSPGFLPAMGIRFLGGRDLDSSNSEAQPTIVINRSTAALWFGKREPLDEIVDWNLGEFQIQVRVAGVVDDLRNETLEHEPFPEVFLDYRHLWKISERSGESLPWQNQTALGVLSMAIRTRNNPRPAMPAIVQMVRTVDPNVGIDAIVPVDDLVTSSVARRRFYAVILGVFAGVAAILSAIGIYGVLAYTVTRRTQEIGIRMALGAERQQVLTLILRKGFTLATIGIALGLAGAAAGTRLLEGMLFGVTPLDRMTFVGVSLAFGLVAMGASYVPARRATRVNPIVALRTE